jgi:hypothetical protein
MVFVAPDTEHQVLRRVAAHVRSGGRIVVGFATDRDYALSSFDRDIDAAGLSVDHRFATWDLQPFVDGSGFAVTVLRVP